MARFAIYEKVPVWVAYRKVIEAESLEEAQFLAASQWAEFGLEEETVILGDTVAGIEPQYDAEPLGEEG